MLCLVRGLLLTALVVAAGCSPPAARSEPSSFRIEPSSSAVPPSHGTDPGNSESSSSSPSLRAPSPSPSRAEEEAAVETAWANSKLAFYRAALTDDSKYPALLVTLVRGGPVYLHSTAYLSALASAGVRGPSKWRIGGERVVSLGVARARVVGCLFDTGSVWSSTGAPAPASLGGGAGLTASDATVVLERGRWLVLADHVSAVSSPKEPGPCHGF